MTARNLCPLVRKRRDNLKFTRTTIIVHFKITPVQFTTQKTDMFHQTGKFIIIRIEIQFLILEVINCIRSILILLLSIADVRHFADTLGVNFGESSFLHLFI